MKASFLLFCILLFSFSLQAQSLEEKIADATCKCIEESADQLFSEETLDKCLPEAMAKILKEGNQEEQKTLAHVEGIKNTFKAVHTLLPAHCQTVRQAELQEKRSRFYKASSSEKANKLFVKGNELMDAGAYSKAVKKFEKAVKVDDQFVFALDHLAVSYRKMEEYEQAIRYYKKSLSIYPEGDVALLNIAVAYSLKEDFPQSLQYYETLYSLYPDNPEGYFGIAKISFILEDFDRALDNIFTAHKMYVREGSDYVNDSKRLIGMIYFKLSELNEKDLFFAKAEEHGVEVNIEE